ncbi:MAG: hypothetical protein H6Q31_232 [Bacteroidetes bacterium]|nr:hypothetical protein [Bacteroidota bacterium]
MAVCKSTNEGTSWSRTFLSTDAGQVNSMQPQPGNNNVLLAGGFTMTSGSYTRYCKLYRSTDAGSSWNQVGASVLSASDEYVNAIAWDPNSANHVLVGSSRGVYASTDAGATWSVLTNTYSPYDIIADPGRSNCFYLGYYNGVYVTTNGGTSWTAMNTGLNTLDIRRLTLDPTNRRLFAGTYGDGIYRISVLTDVPGNEVPGTPPLQFALNQNYPNPFNPATTITFTVPESDVYQLAVYDMLGQVVAVLLDGRLEAGNHTVAFDGATLASGTYFCRLTGHAGTLVRTMALIR